MAWYQPQNLREYGWRLFSPYFAALLLMVFFPALGELRFDWAERVIGTYLATTNDGRPESGAIWEVGQQARSASQALEKIVTDRLAFQREAREAVALSDLAERLQPGQGAMISLEHFRRLYLELPEDAAREVASPLRLLEILTRRNCDRVYLRKTTSTDDLLIYLLNTENQVLETLDFPADLINLSKEGKSLGEGRLEDWPDFQGRIYPAERFFAEIGSLGEEVAAGVVLQPGRLLAIDGSILRVGIGDEVSGGYIRLGFEALVAGVPRVLLTRGREWAVWQIHSRLESRSGAGDATGGSSPGGHL
jgi:hypothetical protein